eukprot:1700452-Rhodomonas_salina.2
MIVRPVVPQSCLPLAGSPPEGADVGCNIGRRVSDEGNLDARRVAAAGGGSGVSRRREAGCEAESGGGREREVVEEGEGGWMVAGRDARRWVSMGQVRGVGPSSAFAVRCFDVLTRTPARASQAEAPEPRD